MISKLHAPVNSIVPAKSMAHPHSRKSTTTPGIKQDFATWIANQEFQRAESLRLGKSSCQLMYAWRPAASPSSTWLFGNEPSKELASLHDHVDDHTHDRGEQSRRLHDHHGHHSQDDRAQHHPRGGHAHQHSHHHGEIGAEEHIRFGLILNLAFAVTEVLIGVLSNSIAILSDAVHDFSDSGSLLISYFAARISKRKADASRTFGYRRASVLAALLNASALLAVTVFVVYHAVMRLVRPVEIKSGYMFLVAGLSILVNGAAVLRMRRDRKSDINLEGAFWHLLEDALGGVAILIGGAIIYFTGWMWVDPVLSLVLSVFIIRGAYGVVLKAVHILLEGTPQDIDLAEVEAALLEDPNVEAVHHLHIWMLDTNHYNMSVHVVLKGTAVPQDLYRNLSEKVKRFKVTHLTVQPEYGHGQCLPCSCREDV